MHDIFSWSSLKSQAPSQTTSNHSLTSSHMQNIMSRDTNKVHTSGATTSLSKSPNTSNMSLNSQKMNLLLSRDNAGKSRPRIAAKRSPPSNLLSHSEFKPSSVSQTDILRKAHKSKGEPRPQTADIYTVSPLKGGNCATLYTSPSKPQSLNPDRKNIRNVSSWSGDQRPVSSRQPSKDNLYRKFTKSNDHFQNM